MTTFIGIDPGKDGAIVAVKNGKIIFKEVMRMSGDGFDVRWLCKLLLDFKKEHKDLFIVTERLQPIILFRVGAWQTFKLGMAYQHVLSAIKITNAPWMEVLPRVWTKRIWEGFEPIYDKKKKPKVNKKTGEKTQKLDSKKMSLQAFEKIFPGTDVRATERSTKPHDGIIDASLLCEFAKRTKTEET
jgi:hypothetical protein